MYNIIERYMIILKKEDVNKFAISKNIYLSNEELNFTYEFIKKNWREILKNPNLFEIERYKDKFSQENFTKVKQLFLEYYRKFGSFL